MQRPTKRTIPEWGKLPSRAPTKPNKATGDAAEKEEPKKKALAWADTKTWKGVGPIEEDWGEQYAGLRLPTVFVLHVDTGAVVRVSPDKDEKSYAQPVWTPQG